MTRNADSPASSWSALERAVAAFERAYARDGGADPADFCPAPGDPLRLPVAVELVRADLEFAARDGRPRRLDDYRSSFPDLFESPDALAGAAFEEYRLRRQSGHPAAPEEYRAKYGIDPSSWADSIPAPSRGGPAAPGIWHRGSVRGPARDLAGGEPGPEAGQIPEPGDEVAGFRLVRVLGRGAFGRVYLAEQSDLAGRYVALKLSTQLVAEAGTLARLQHSNIVPVYSVHRAGRFQAICMPYLGSVTLAAVLRRLGGLASPPRTAEELVRAVAGGGDAASPPREASGDPPSPQGVTSAGPLEALRGKTHVDAALWIAAELADGLAHAHERGIIHRDLKPANVLLSDDGRPMLLDFNLAGDARRAGAAAEFVGGTPSHMAPEQLAAVAGEPSAIDARCDVYALGLILRELLTGRPMLQDSAGQIHERLAELREARKSPPPPARTLNPSVTPAVDAILARALAPSPGDRYPSASQMREDLLRQLDNRPLRHVREPSLRERLAKGLRRNPWVKSVPFVAGLVAVVAGLGFGAYTYRTRQLDRTEASLRLESFRDAVEAARPRLILPDPDDRDLASGLSLGRAALALYGVSGAGESDGPSAFRHLGDEETRAVRADLGELGFLVAGYEHRRAERAEDAEAQRSTLVMALGLNALAGEFLGDDPARRLFVAVQRAQLLASAGREEEARAIRDSVAPQAESGEGLWLALSEFAARREHRKGLALLRAREPERGGTIGYWRARGAYHAAVGEWAEAAAALTTALALSARPDADLLGRRGLAHLNDKDYRAAAADYEAAARLAPDDPAILRDRAQARLGLGDFAGAVADLDRAQALDPAHTRVFFMRSLVHARAGDRRAAERDQAEGLARRPGDETSWVARGLARRARDPAGAIADFDEALRRDPTSRRALQNKASVLSEDLGRAEEAVAVLDRLVAIDPEYVPARAGRGVLLARLGRRDAAAADAVASLALSDAPFTRYQVAGIYALTSRSHPADRAEAIRLLASAFRDKEGLPLVRDDPDLVPLREDPRFREVVEAARTLEAASRRDPPRPSAPGGRGAPGLLPGP